MCSGQDSRSFLDSVRLPGGLDAFHERETFTLGENLAQTLTPGTFVLLHGDLGAGKTALVRGIASGLGADPDDVSSPTFVLDPPLRVKEGNWIALTVSTWAPLLGLNLTGRDWWRSSRAKGSCEGANATRQFAMEDLRGINRFGCTYSGARLLYTATYIPDNHPTVETETP